ncbi:ADP-ribose pyrophosphatase YjhB, NUDIX family [Deinococcus reticulitermitis]|uniref:ADP-ribose pyrophosphatase YjhB, NUDIX family n=1 Tax=Deinococcus reticulitermitis TaxID=856736 RepID=A0A1H6RRX8_9DEIO|nr:NUDIX domain-containing protein [Deinococcus reticulitermitis]SEI58618.1 ADP-ribose pyrophosphatase YjhB, NUDIX family [Deinococcus reticulitermitis]
MPSPPSFHVLARAVIEHDGQVLLARARGQTLTFLPGGHVEPGEGLRACLTRELREETGLAFQIGPLLGVAEHEWSDGEGQKHYEIAQVFTASSPGLTSQRPVASREPHLTFEWAPLQELEARKLMPPPLRSLLMRQEWQEAWFASTVAGSAKRETGA